MQGRTLKHYEILEPLGAGGMGEVYRARDTTLKREVAIKVLPEDLTADVERLARLEREAQLLAAVNHPNIEVIHGLEEAEGVRFIVLELIEGESLAEMISRGRIDEDRALGIGRQIAEALEAAHARGIIHRDLKPGNVLITPEGRAKVLDFGLAKGSEDDSAGREISFDITESPTVAAATRAGIILGTAAYMSPEQARGKPLDKRTDIWSFGCVLYEMLTGRKAFDGETVTDVLAAIVERELDWNGLPAGVPPLVQLLLRRCLEKDPYRRLHDIADARIEIVNAINDPGAAIPGVAAVIEEMPLWKRLVPWGTAAVMALVTVTLVLQIASREEPVAGFGGLANIPMAFPEGLSLDSSGFGSFAVSPDGERIGLVVKEGETSRLVLRDLAEAELRVVPGSEGASTPFFSPDGRWVAFFVGETLWKAAVDGGNPVPLCDTQQWGSRGATWSPDDVIVFASDPYAGLMRVSAAGGEPEAITYLDVARGDLSHRWPTFLPGGRIVVFNIYMGGSFENSMIAAYSLDSGETKILLERGLDPFYVDTGHLLYGSRNTLFAVPFDTENLEVSGSPVPVLDGVLVVSEGPGYVGASVSGNGMLFYRPSVDVEHEIVLVDRSGNEESLPASRRRGFGSSGPRYSPDGGFLAIPNERDIWVYDIARDVFSPFVSHESGDMRPLWAPDGQTIIFTSDRSGTRDLYRIPTDGSATEELLLSRPNWLLASSICEDGQTLLYAESDPVTRQDIWALPLAGNREPELLVRSEYADGAAEFAPGCQWLAYTSDVSGRYEVYVRPLGRSGRPVQISTSGGDEPAWGPDGREIFYREDERLMAVPVTMEEGLTVGLPQVLFEASYAGYGNAIPRSYDVSPDGQRFAFLKPTSGPPVSQLALVLNWVMELERLAPSGR